MLVLNQITPPSIKPLLYTDVADQVRADLTAESLIVELYIAAVTARAEFITRRALISQTWELSLDQFPQEYVGGRLGAVRLPLSPVRSITSIIYTDVNGALQTLNAANYTLTGDDPNQVVSAYGVSWPSTRNQPGAVKIRYVAGYGNLATDVPEGIRMWMLLNVANLYENRESIVVGQRAQSVELATMADSLLDSYRLVQF